MKKIKWTDRIRNDEILSIGEKLNVMRLINKTCWIGHMLRGNCLLQNAMEGKAGVKRTRRDQTWNKLLSTMTLDAQGYVNWKHQLITYLRMHYTVRTTHCRHTIYINFIFV